MTRPVLIVTCMVVMAVAFFMGFLFHQRNLQQSAIPEIDSPRPPQSEQQLVGQPRADFVLPDLDGAQRQVSEWDGQVLVINFWATWCPPCRHEIPEFIQLQSEFSGQGLQFVGIALQQAEEVREFAADMGMNYPVLVGEQEVIKISKAYGNHLGALPYTVIIDRQGLIQFIRRGPLKGEEAKQVITNLL